MKITLLHSTPLWVCARAIRTCWDSHDKSDTEFYNVPIDDAYCEAHDISFDFHSMQVGVCGEKDKELIARVGNKNKHSSTLEHITMTFEIDGISRACLIELTRHRIASYSVQSSRYVLHKLLKNEEPFTIDDMDRAEKYVVFTGISTTDTQILNSLANLRLLVKSGESNDVIKYAMPEAFKTSLVWTINARSLQNFLELRTSKSALPEIRKLALAVFEALPKEHKYLFEDFVNKD